MSFKMTCFFVKILADVVVKKRIKDEMSKIFVHLFLYTIGGFDRRTQYITSIGLFYKNVVDFTWRVFDSEELVVPSEGASM